MTGANEPHSNGRMPWWSTLTLWFSFSSLATVSGIPMPLRSWPWVLWHQHPLASGAAVGTHNPDHALPSSQPWCQPQPWPFNALPSKHLSDVTIYLRASFWSFSSISKKVSMMWSILSQYTCAFCGILRSWVGEIFWIIIWHLNNVGFGCATLCHTGFLSVSVSHNALDADLMWGTQGCGFHKSKVHNEIFGTKPWLLNVMGCMCTLIFTNHIVTFVNANQWESRIHNYCSISQQSRQSLSVRSKEMINFQHVVWSLACARHGRYLVEKLKSVNNDVTSLT